MLCVLVYVPLPSQDPPTTIGPHHREEEGVEGHKHGGASSS